MFSVCMIYLWISFTFNLFVFLYFKFISYGEIMLGLIFFIYSENFWLLFGVFSPFTFNPIIDMVEFGPTILLVVFLWSHHFCICFLILCSYFLNFFWFNWIFLRIPFQGIVAFQLYHFALFQLVALGTTIYTVSLIFHIFLTFNIGPFHTKYNGLSKNIDF